jgi:hypothetical protein
MAIRAHEILHSTCDKVLHRPRSHKYILATALRTFTRVHVKVPVAIAIVALARKIHFICVSHINPFYFSHLNTLRLKVNPYEQYYRKADSMSTPFYYKRKKIDASPSRV